MHDYFAPRLSKGDRVRTLKQKAPFEKGYTRVWSEEIYIIAKALTKAGVDYYKLSTIAGNLIPQTKYYWELNLVSKYDSKSVRRTAKSKQS